MAYAKSNDADQPARPRRLISALLIALYISCNANHAISIHNTCTCSCSRGHRFGALHAQGYKPQLTRLIMKVYYLSVGEYKCMFKTDLYAFRIKALLVSETKSVVHAVKEELLLHRKGRKAEYAGVILFFYHL